jgi:hypothetical protein
MIYKGKVVIMDQNFLREINNDQKTPKNRKKVREDGFYEASEVDYKDFWENEDTSEMLTE